MSVAERYKIITIVSDMDEATDGRVYICLEPALQLQCTNTEWMPLIVNNILSPETEP